MGPDPIISNTNQITLAPLFARSICPIVYFVTLAKESPAISDFSREIARGKVTYSGPKICNFDGAYGAGDGNMTRWQKAKSGIGSQGKDMSLHIPRVEK